MENRLKKKIISLNSYSILLIVLIFAILNFFVVYYVLNDAYKKEVKVIKEQYLSSQKTIIKNQVNNFINFIEHTRKLEKQNKLKILQRNVTALSRVLSISNPKNFAYMLSNAKMKIPVFDIGLSDEYGNIVFTTNKNVANCKLRRKAIKIGFGKIITVHTKKGLKYSYLLKFKNKIDGKIYIIGNSIFQSTIDKIVQNIVLDRLKTFRFGAKNNGYISVGKILNYKGGKDFAKLLAVPIEPKLEGTFISSDIPDVKGNPYRKEYIKIMNTKGEGYVKYWFYKSNDNKVYQKISYVKLYKPFDWLIFAGVYLDDINKMIAHKEKITKAEMNRIFSVYLVFLIIFLIISYVISKYENKILTQIIEDYEKLIHKQNEELIEINKNLEKEVQEKTEKLLNSLLIDTLTNLSNREKLILDIKDKNLYIAIINIDSFKEINDFYGIEVGDEVLRKFANILKNISKNSYKLSADEFAITDENLERLVNIIKKLEKLLFEKPLKIYNEIIHITFNCGIGKNLVEADMALKYAKKHKYETVVVFNEELDITKKYKNNIKWKYIINEAIEKDNILAYVQPIVNNQTQKVEKYECLVRLKHEDKVYSPYFFLDISKHTGKYYDIQKIMVEKSFKKFSTLNYKFSINLSLQDLTNDKFKQFLLNKINEYNIQTKLIIELLEDEVLLTEEVLDFLHHLTKLGIRIAIDDFGSGYSNFAYLIKDLPVSILKIDGSLVKNIATSKKDYKVLKTITYIAKEFDFEIVAEFVENKEIYELLKEMKIDYSQGYYFSAPFDINELKPEN